MKMAILEWEHHIKLAEQHEKGGAIPPPEIYLFRYSKLLPLIEKGRMTPKNLGALQQEVEDYMNERRERTHRKRAEKACRDQSFL